MPDFFSFINSVLWGSVMIYLLFGAGCWFTFRTGFVQFRYIRQFGKSLKNSIHPQPGGLTSFQSLCTSLAARVGSGNLAGVALAITAGGPGAVFWMWVAAFIGMATSFAECSLAQLYKERDANGQFRGGPAWYMARGLGMRWMGVLFAVFLLIAYGIIFSGIQANAVARALSFSFDFPPLVTGIILAVFCSAGDHSRSSWRRPAHAGVCPVDGDNLGTDQPGDLRNEYRATSPRHLVYF